MDGGVVEFAEDFVFKVGSRLETRRANDGGVGSEISEKSLIGIAGLFAQHANAAFWKWYLLYVS